MKPFSITLACFVVALGCQTQAQTDQVPEPAEPSGIEGAWRVTSMQAVSPTGEVSELPIQESLMLFFDGFYSNAFSRHESPSPYFTARFNATDEERMARLTGLTVNTGRYELAPGKLTLLPIFALTPEFMGGAAEFEYELSGDQLTLTERNVVSVDGVQSPVFAAGELRIFRLERVR